MKLFFTPGPAQVYPSLERHVLSALNEQIPSISHRSKQYEKIHQSTVETLRMVFGLPEDFHVFFHGSATEIWERLLENCVLKHSAHFVNGSFSERFYKAACTLQLDVHVEQVEMGQGFYEKTLELPASVEMINFTHNETSTGIITSEAYIHSYRDKYPDSLITVDMVSSAPYPRLDWQKVDAAYFSVQKCFGLPAGLGVLFVNNSCIEKAAQKEGMGKYIGTYHSFTEQHKMSLKHQTVETPNVLGIYLLGKICTEMLDEGIETLRTRLFSQSKKLYSFLETHERWKPFTHIEILQSPTVVVANIPEGSQEILAQLAQEGLILGDGYGPMKGKQIRIANFPAVTTEEIEKLIAALSRIS